MKKSFCKYFVYIVLITFFACNDNDDCNCSGEIYGKWEAISFLSLESRGYPKTDDYNPVIEFKQDGTVVIKLDVNSCSGDFEISGETGINISNAGCTKMCCDSDFSTKFIEMLSQVGSYEIEDDVLKLNVSGWGWIKLEWISE